VLHEAESCGASDLDPKTYGVIVSCDRRRGLLLPDLEGVETVDQQIDIARKKAGIAPHEGLRLERFKVDRHA
jgi:AMMECR1 domain-containing protein